MKLSYIVLIEEPSNHLVKVKLNLKTDKMTPSLEVFLPSWSPGSYLMREYARNIRVFRVFNSKGQFLDFEQTKKGTYLINTDGNNSIDIEYEVYCHEIGVRNCHVDNTHAFLHGPAYLVGLNDHEIVNPEIEFRFPPLWSKITTGLADIGKDSLFKYTAKTYDDLLDCPVEIGCHETDGFMAHGKEHHLAWYGECFPGNYKLKDDIKTIVEYVGKTWGEIPYESFTFITHFAPKIFGGLEHKNSTALHFDGRLLANRKDYVSWLALVAHEYFHTWNIKRIRPIEYGPFDYENEAYSTMLWLAEGLTSFLDELLVYRAGLCSLEEYLDMQKGNLARYYSIPGRKFHSLEQSSFNAWTKLYRPDENSNNSSISYYLKGGLVFSILHFEFLKSGKDINDLLVKLWSEYKKQPEVGFTKEQVLQFIEELGDKKIRDLFEHMISGTEEIDFEKYYKEIGIVFDYKASDDVSFGAVFENIGERVIVKSVDLDGSFYKAGINAADEILAINNQRFFSSDIENSLKYLKENQVYKFTISRMNKIQNIEVSLSKADKKLEKLIISDESKAKKAFDYSFAK